MEIQYIALHTNNRMSLQNHSEWMLWLVVAKHTWRWLLDPGYWQEFEKFKNAIWSKLKTVDDHTAHVHSEIKCNRVNAVTLSPFKSGKFQNIEPCCCKKYLIQVWLSSQDIRARARATRESIYREWWELLLCSLRSLFFCSSIPQKCTKCITAFIVAAGVW